MKSRIWYGIGALLLAGPVQGQNITGTWQGVETDPQGEGGNWPAVLRLQKSSSQDLFGVLYQEVGGQPAVSVTFRMQGRQAGGELRLEHRGTLTETGRTPGRYWCDGAIALTYDAKLEKLTGRATYRPVAGCEHGTFAFYRVRLKSPGTVPAGTLRTHRVSGRNVLWFADADLRQPLAAGNAYAIRLSKTTTFYLTQSYYPTRESPVVPITIQVAGPAPKSPAASVRVGAVPALAPLPPPAAVPGLATSPPSAPAFLIGPAPVVLPTVLFKLGTAELLPESAPALNRLAEELRARPALKIRVAGHTDKIGESEKNQTLSEQRAEAVKAYLAQADLAPERIVTVGYGDARPLHPAPDARNRRVEVTEVK